MIYDVSIAVSESVPVWPGAPKYVLKQKQTLLPNGDAKMDSHFSMIPHCGTHIDSPLHYNSKGVAIENLAIDLLIGPARVYEHTADRHMTGDDLAKWDFDGVERALFKTVNSGCMSTGEFDTGYISLMPDAIDFLLSRSVKLLGVDGFSIGPFGELNDRNHIAFCGSGGVIIELLDLSAVAAGDYDLFALPVKLAGLEAAPARVVLVK